MGIPVGLSVLSHSYAAAFRPDCIDHKGHGLSSDHIDLCGIIDRCILPEFKVQSIYQLNPEKRWSIHRILTNEFHVQDMQARRCLFLWCGRTCKCGACTGDFSQVWPQKWPKPAFLLPYLRKMWFTELLRASTAGNVRCGGEKKCALWWKKIICSHVRT